MRRMHLLLCGVLALTAVSIVEATATKAADGGGAPGPIEALRANGARVLPLGSRGGLDGYFVIPAGTGGYSVYVTGDGHAVAGLLYGPDGTEITGGQLAAARSGGDAAWAAGGRRSETDARGTVVAHAEGGDTGTPSSPTSRADLFERSTAAFGFSTERKILGDCRPERFKAVKVAPPTSRLPAISLKGISAAPSK